MEITTEAKIAVRVPRDLHKKVRQEAADEELSMNQVVVQALRVYFQLPKGAAARRRKKPV